MRYEGGGRFLCGALVQMPERGAGGTRWRVVARLEHDSWAPAARE